LILHEVTGSATVNYLTATGTLSVGNCSSTSPIDVVGGIREELIYRVNELLGGLHDDPSFREALNSVNKQFAASLDVWDGPLASAVRDLPGGLAISGGQYVQTGPGGIQGDVRIWHEGADLAVDFVAYTVGSRFPYSAVPSSSLSGVVGSTHHRARGDGLDFDIGLIVNGATVNQVLRALAAGKPAIDGSSGDVGLLDFYEYLDDFGDFEVHPSVAPLYLPSPPIGWPADGNVHAYVPSLRISIPRFARVATMAVDIRVGIDAFIAENYLVPFVKAAQVEPRFLRLGSAINAMTDPAYNPPDYPDRIAVDASATIRETVPAKLATSLAPVRIPDLHVFGGPPVFLQNLTVETVGGHLGVYVDVETTPAPDDLPVSVTWANGLDGRPTSVEVEVDDEAIPGLGVYTFEWTFTDGANGALLYQSPGGGESASKRTVDASRLSITTDPCTGDQYVALLYRVVIRRGEYVRQVSSSAGYVWPGTPPSQLPAGCYEPNPPPEPEPEPDPDPVELLCLRQPWKCQDY
jgi:hypothetical protein